MSTSDDTAYISFDVLYKNLSGDWKPLPGFNQTLKSHLEVFTLTANPVQLKVDLTSSSLTGLYISENNIQWHIGNNIIKKGAEVSYVCPYPKLQRVTVYIARSNGTVIGRGDTDGNEAPIIIKSKNFVGTNIFANPVGGQTDSISSVDTFTDGTTGLSNLGTVVHLTAGSISMPLRITTQHSWQFYNSVSGKPVTTLYADRAGLRKTSTGVFGNDSAPLKTSAYDKNKYAHFQKTWRFCSDIDGLDPIDRKTTTTKKLYVAKNTDNSGFSFCTENTPGAEFAGTSGTDDVYYIDDTSAYITSAGEATLYRLMFQLDTTGWPDYAMNERFETEELHKDLNPMQAPYDYLLANVHPATAQKILFSSTGIAGSVFDISKHKFQNTQIPFVYSLGTNNDTIIKDISGVSGDSYSVHIPWSSAPATKTQGVYYLGLSSSTDTLDSSDFSITVNPALSSIEEYSSKSFILSSTSTYSNVVLVGALNTTQTGEISGISSKFDIHSKSGKYTFFKYGEEIDYGSTINGYILQESVNQHPRLKNMFNAIFGEFNDLPESVGKIIYEKISNFTSNNVDIDACNTAALYSLAEEVGYSLEGYNISYPGGIKRLVDTLSVGISKLVGYRNMNYDDFTDETISTGSTVRYGRNLGTTLLSTDTYVVTAGVPIVAKELYGNNMFKVIPTYIQGSASDPGWSTHQNLNGLSSYPLSSYDHSWNWGLTFPSSNAFSDYYEFYNYIDNKTFPVTSFEQQTGMINWDKTNELELSTIKETSTAYSDWYGRDGIIETSLEYAIRNGLQVIDE